MKSNHTPLLLTLLALLLLGGVFYWNNTWKKKRFDWNDRWSKNAYNEKSKEPYGTWIIRRLLDQYFLGHPCQSIEKNVATELPADTLHLSDDRNSYVFVGEALYLDSLDLRQLLNFVEDGGTALISSKTIPNALMDHLYVVECKENLLWSDYGTHYDSNAVVLSLHEPALPQPLRLHYARQNKPHPYFWHAMDTAFFCEDMANRPLGYLNDSLVNFAEFPFGDGRFLLHTTPLVFTNYILLKPESRPYVGGILSHLPDNGTIYWDAASHVPEQVGRLNNGNSDNNRLPDEHPLTYILQKPALAWAWYLLFGLAILWVIFRGKRRQQVIPILPPNENTSWQFISAIANLHFRERNYRGMARAQMRLFLGWLRERYNIAIPLQDPNEAIHVKDDFFQKIALLSEIPEEKIKDIFHQYTAAVRYEPTEAMMINLHTAIESFMKHAK